MAGFVFQVEFGMNETPLTRALEDGNWSIAEHHIINCPNASFLDDGCYQRVPLYICLCGNDEFGMEKRPRTLYLAHMLIERGANVNLRVPAMNYGAEYMSPGKSCVELLVDFYLRLCMGSPAWCPQQEPVVGLHQEPVSHLQVLKAQLRELIFDALHHGGDLGVMDEARLNPVHRAASSGDLPLLRLLCDCGANLSAVDSLGNTPLLCLCWACDTHKNEDNLSSAVDTLRVTFNDGRNPVENPGQYKGEEKDKEVQEEGVDGSDDHTEVNTNINPQLIDAEVLGYLIRQEGIQVNHQNQALQTALFHMMMRGDIRGCQILLDAGADPTLKGCIWQSRRHTHELSPLFASLASVQTHFWLPGHDKHAKLVGWTRMVGLLVDQGYFDASAIQCELRDLVHSLFPDLTHLTRLTCNTSDRHSSQRTQHTGLLSLMLGHTSSGLKQMAVRTVMQCCLKNHSWLLSVCASRIPNNPQVELILSDPHIFQQFISSILNSSELQSLICQLDLPSSLVHNFEAHLLYLRLAVWLQDAWASKPPRSSVLLDESDTDFSTDTDSDDQVQGDSDLDYW